MVPPNKVSLPCLRTNPGGNGGQRRRADNNDLRLGRLKHKPNPGRGSSEGVQSGSRLRAGASQHHIVQICKAKVQRAGGPGCGKTRVQRKATGTPEHDSTVLLPKWSCVSSTNQPSRQAQGGGSHFLQHRTTVHSIEGVAEVKLQENLVNMAGVAVEPVPSGVQSCFGAPRNPYPDLKRPQVLPRLTPHSPTQNLTHKPTYNLAYSNGPHATCFLGSA